MTETDYKYGPDDELPPAEERDAWHKGIPYNDIHPDNDVWPSHSMAVQRTFIEEIIPRIDDDDINDAGTMLTPAMSSYHASMSVSGAPADEIPLSIRMAVDMAGWEIKGFNGHNVRIYDPDGPLTGDNHA